MGRMCDDAQPHVVLAACLARQREHVEAFLADATRAPNVERPTPPPLLAADLRTRSLLVVGRAGVFEVPHPHAPRACARTPHTHTLAARTSGTNPRHVLHQRNRPRVGVGRTCATNAPCWVKISWRGPGKGKSRPRFASHQRKWNRRSSLTKELERPQTTNTATSNQVHRISAKPNWQRGCRLHKAMMHTGRPHRQECQRANAADPSATLLQTMI